MSASILARTLAAGAIFSALVLDGRPGVAEPICNWADTKPQVVSKALPVMGRDKKSASPATGMVAVDVALDEHSKITGAAVSTSTNPALDAIALAAARGSTFQTRVTDCHPVASRFLFVMTVAVAPAKADIRGAIAPSQPAPETAAAASPRPSSSPGPGRSAISAVPSPSPSASAGPAAATPRPSGGG